MVAKIYIDSYTSNFLTWSVIFTDALTCRMTREQENSNAYIEQEHFKLQTVNMN